MFDLCPVNISRYVLREKREPDHNGGILLGIIDNKNLKYFKAFNVNIIDW